MDALRRLGITRVVNASRIRAGGVRVRGVPAILAGVAAIVLAAGATRAVTSVALAVPHALREARAYRIASRERPELRP